MTLEVIGAGVGRTGTYSLKLALEQLGFGPCHHMEEVILDPPRHMPLWLAALAGKPDWEAVFDGYNSAVDWPTAAFWPELAAHHPGAKVILTARNPESWYASFSQTIFKFLSSRDEAPPPMQAFIDFGTAVIARSGFTIKSSRDDILKAFADQGDAVIGAIPAERLLVYRVKDGWEPLCRFLGKEVPTTPFPRSNDRDEFWNRLRGGPTAAPS